MKINQWSLDSARYILLKHHVRHSKNKSLLDKVELLDANPQYAHVHLPSEKETIVSVKHLAPCVFRH